MAMHRYILALGSNRVHGRYGRPASVIAAAIGQLAEAGLIIEDQSSVITSRPIGPSYRSYANTTLRVTSRLSPPELLALCKRIERDFGRRRGRRWGSRVIDIDIILWSGGQWASRTLQIPHTQWQRRDFVADGVARIARDWHLPRTPIRAHHPSARLPKPRAFRQTDG